MRHAMTSPTFGNARSGLEGPEYGLVPLLPGCETAALHERQLHVPVEGRPLRHGGWSNGPLIHRATGTGVGARPPGTAKPAARLSGARLAGVPLRIGLGRG
jgi:hypothetical protein